MIYIIRHGKTELNKSKVLQGRSNYPLNREGVCQAEEAAARLGDVTFAHGNTVAAHSGAFEEQG